MELNTTLWVLAGSAVVISSTSTVVNEWGKTSPLQNYKERLKQLWTGESTVDPEEEQLRAAIEVSLRAHMETIRQKNKIDERFNQTIESMRVLSRAHRA